MEDASLVMDILQQH